MIRAKYLNDNIAASLHDKKTKKFARNKTKTVREAKTDYGQKELDL